MAPSRQHEHRNRPLTLLLRFLPHQGLDRQMVGHAEVIETGEIVSIAHQNDLIDLVQRLSSVKIDGRAED